MWRGRVWGGTVRQGPSLCWEFRSRRTRSPVAGRLKGRCPPSSPLPSLALRLEIHFFESFGQHNSLRLIYHSKDWDESAVVRCQTRAVGAPVGRRDGAKRFTSQTQRLSPPRGRLLLVEDTLGDARVFSEHLFRRRRQTGRSTGAQARRRSPRRAAGAPPASRRGARLARRDRARRGRAAR